MNISVILHIFAYWLYSEKINLLIKKNNKMLILKVISYVQPSTVGSNALCGTKVLVAGTDRICVTKLIKYSSRCEIMYRKNRWLQECQRQNK